MVPIYFMEALSNTSNDTKDTTTDAKPNAEFVADETVIDAGETVQFEFTGEPGDKPSKYDWDFGDGTSHSTEKNPSHLFSTAGNFTVKLTVTDNDGDSDSAKKKIRVEGETESTSDDDSSESSESSSHRIPVYDPYYFLLTFIILTAMSFIIIKRKYSS